MIPKNKRIERLVVKTVINENGYAVGTPKSVYLPV